MLTRQPVVAREVDVSPAFRVVDIDDQVAALTRLFPGIGGPNKQLVKKPLPRGANFWGVFPRMEVVGKNHDAVLENVLRLLVSGSSGLFNLPKTLNSLYCQHYRTAFNAARAIEEIETAQADFGMVLVPVSYGTSRRGLSGGVVREKIGIWGAEFGLNIFYTAIVLLVHPNALEDLRCQSRFNVGCAGEEYCTDLSRGGAYSQVPHFSTRARRFDLGLSGVSEDGRSNMIWPSGFIV